MSTTATFEYLSTVVGQDKLTLTVMDDDGAISSDTILITVKDIVSSVTWVTPTKNICKKYDGQYYGNQCSANLENAQIICSTIGASLPTIETLRAIVINCGGVVNDYDNISNKEYQFCYKEEGFSHNVYWSMSSPNNSLTSSTWTLNFSGGNDGQDRETNKFNVRCNR